MKEKLSKEAPKAASFISGASSVLPTCDFDTLKRLALCSPDAYFGLRHQLIARFINMSQASIDEMWGFQAELDVLRLNASNLHLAMSALAERSITHVQLLQELVACLDRELQTSSNLSVLGVRNIQDGKSELLDTKIPSSSA